jgi:hypothetical protein
MRTSLAYALLLLTSLALAAAGEPAKAPLPTLETPLACTLQGLANTPPKPLFQTTLQAPCMGYTVCQDNSEVSCYSGQSVCMISDSCWVICEDNIVHYCPGAQSRPECVVY